MKHLMILLVATAMSAMPVLAEDRAVANTEIAIQYEVAAYEFSARSFFEPKTEADLSALVSLDHDLENSLQEELN